MMSTLHTNCRCLLLCPSPHRVGHHALMAVVCLSICSVLTLSREWRGVGWKLAGSSGYGWPVTPFRGWKVKVTRPIKAEMENMLYLELITGTVRRCASPTCTVTSNVVSLMDGNTKIGRKFHGQRSPGLWVAVPSHHLQGQEHIAAARYNISGRDFDAVKNCVVHVKCNCKIVTTRT